MAKNNFEKNLLTSIKDIFKSVNNGQEQKPNQTPDKPAEKRVSFDFETGKKYKKTDEKDIEDNCPHCGAGYQGPLEPFCSYCVSPRKVYFIEEISEAPLTLKSETKEEQSSSDDIEFPRFGDNKLKLGDNIDRVKIVGESITIGDYVKVKFIGASKIIQIDDVTKLGKIISPRVLIGDYLEATEIVARELKVGDASKIDTLLVASNGNALVGDYSSVGVLILGPNSKAVFGDNCNIKQLFLTKNSVVESGDYFKCSEETEISIADFNKKFKQFTSTES